MASPQHVADTDGLASEMAATNVSDSGAVQPTSSSALTSADGSGGDSNSSPHATDEDPTEKDPPESEGNGRTPESPNDEGSDADGSGGDCNEEGCICGLHPQTAMPIFPMVEHYNFIAPFYSRSPDQVARATWMKDLVEKQKIWIGFDQTKSDIKALDYAAGTGFMSLAIAPHVNEIIAIDAAHNMIDEYNEMVAETKEAHSDCAMQAICGSLVKLLDGQGTTNEIIHLDSNFDFVAMCLAVDFLALDNDYDRLEAALSTLAGRLKDGGSILILDIEMDYAPHEASDDDVYFEKLRNGRKSAGHGSREVAAVLETLGMGNISIKGDLKFRADVSFFGMSFVREEIYFMLKASKGANYHARADKDDSEGSL